MELLNKENAPSIEAKDVFISYRRKDGATAARLLCDALERRHISVFFDRESLESGNFDDALRQHLDAARNILVVVSQEMFKRGLTDGNYDPLIVEEDWVYKELRISMEAGKNIIPVFVNGVDSFPSNLPEPIAEIALENALTLNHEHFEAAMSSLIGRLETPKHRLLAAYLETDKEVYEDGDTLDSLLRVCQKLSDKGGEDIEAALIKLIRSNWERTSSSDEKAFDALLGDGGPKFIKLLCEKLDLDNTGGVRRMKENLRAWLKQDQFVRYSQSATEDDRIIKVRYACAAVYKSHEERQRIASQIGDTFRHVELSSMRSSQDIFDDVFEAIDVEEFFEEMGSFFQEQEIKNICDYMLVNSRGRKKELIDRIVAFANYQYGNEDETD